METGITLYNVMGNDSGESYTSLTPTSKEAALTLYKAMTNPDDGLGNHINEKIFIRHLFVQSVEMVNEETGELVPSPRIVIIDESGKTFVTVSKGIYNSLKNICAICGTPETWETPVAVKVLQKSINGKKFLTLDVVDFGKNI